MNMKQLVKGYEGMLHQHSPLKFPIGDFTPYRSWSAQAASVGWSKHAVQIW